MGHEIGYHYEDLSLAKGNMEKTIIMFRDHLDKLRQIAPVMTIAMHGRPMSRQNNADIWNVYDLRSFGIIGDAFLSIDYKDIYYFTDTGRTWSDTYVNIRDRVNSGLKAPISSTKDLIKFILENKSKKVAIVTHPERWDNNYGLWTISLIKDNIFNLGKLSLISIRKNNR